MLLWFGLFFFVVIWPTIIDYYCDSSGYSEPEEK